MSDYLYNKKIDNVYRQVVTLYNSTYYRNGKWVNEVLLYNKNNNVYDKVYQNIYSATLSDQQVEESAWWGPIMETFQPSYSNINEMGFNDVRVGSFHSNSYEETYLSTANTIMKYRENSGLEYDLIDANHTFLIS